MSRRLIHMYAGRDGSLRREDRELIPFAQAVPHVYTQLTGVSGSSFGNPLCDALLHEVAQAIANLVTIYGAPNDQVPVKRLPVAEVKHGVFQRAATVLRTNDEIEYRRLYIRRGCVRAAAAVLKKSGVLFATAEVTAAALDGAEVRSEVGLAARPAG